MGSLRDWEMAMMDFQRNQSLKAWVWSGVIAWGDLRRYLYRKSAELGLFLGFWKYSQKTYFVEFFPLFYLYEEALLNQGLFPQVSFAGLKDLFRIPWVLITTSSRN